MPVPSFTLRATLHTEFGSFNAAALSLSNARVWTNEDTPLTFERKPLHANGHVSRAGTLWEGTPYSLDLSRTYMSGRSVRFVGGVRKAIATAVGEWLASDSALERIARVSGARANLERETAIYQRQAEKARRILENVEQLRRELDAALEAISVDEIAAHPSVVLATGAAV